MFRERLSSTQKERSSSSDKTSQQNQNQEDEVYQVDGNNKRVNEGSRVSVICSSPLQNIYSVPVSNPFDILGN